MDFFKFLKTLNSAQASWQITLAIILGMASGFLPLATPINFILIFIAFAINIPLGVFFFISASFAAIGYLLDPLFASLGYTILTLPSLQALFTSMYNYAPTLWTSFNYTILMGSLIVSIVLGVVLFPILNAIINKQRDFLEAKFKESRFFSWLNPYSEEKLQEKPGVMRWWAAGLFIAIVGVFVAIALLVIDPLLKVGLEYGLSKATKRDVLIGSLKSELANSNLLIKNISFINREKKGDDIFVDKVVVELNPTRLFEKKIDFTLLSFGNILLDQTLRASKQAPTQTTPQTKSAADTKEEQSGFELPSMPDPQSLLDREGLSSIKEAKKMKSEIEAISQKWQERVTNEQQKEKIDQLKKELKALQKSARKIDSLDDIKDILAKADTLKKESKALREELKRYKKEYKEDKKIVQKYLKEMRTLPAEDYEALLKKYSLDQNGAMNLIGTHFSASLEKYLRTGLEYYDFIKPYISSDEESEEKQQQRMKGAWIHYTNTTHFPRFVIHRADANIIKAKKNFKCKVKDISNNQKIYQKPIKGALLSKSKTYKQIYVKFEHNELHKKSFTKIEGSVKEYRVDDISLAKKLSLKSALINATSDITITEFKNIDSETLIYFKKSNLRYAPIESKTDKIVQNILSGIKTFQVDAWVAGSLKIPAISLKTDLDTRLKKGINRELDKEVQKYKKELKSAINKRFKEELGDIDLGEFNDVEKLIDSAMSENGSLQESIDKNLSKDRLKKELKSDSAKKLKNKILKFF